MATAYSHIIHFSEKKNRRMMVIDWMYFNNLADVGINKPKTVCGLWFWHLFNTLVNPILIISWEHPLPQLNTQEPWHVPRPPDIGHAVESHFLSYQVEGSCTLEQCSINSQYDTCSDVINRVQHEMFLHYTPQRFAIYYYCIQWYCQYLK